VHHHTISRAVATARTQDLLADAAGGRAARPRRPRRTAARRGVAAIAAALASGAADNQDVSFNELY